MNWFQLRRRLAKARHAAEEPKRQRPVPRYDRFVNFLHKKGFKRLGGGAFSSVYHKTGSDRVIKINHAPDQWSRYALWAAKHGWAGRFAPKVYSYKYHKEGYSVAVMEKLACTVGELRDDKKHPHYGTLAFLDIALRAPANDNMAAAADCFQPELSKFMREFAAEFRHARYDLHAANAMLRPDGSFVLTDPVYGGNCIRERLRLRDFAA